MVQKDTKIYIRLEMFFNGSRVWTICKEEEENEFIRRAGYTCLHYIGNVDILVLRNH
jgi:hypothetical protein